MERGSGGWVGSRLPPTHLGNQVMGLAAPGLGGPKHGGAVHAALEAKQEALLPTPPWAWTALGGGEPGP